MAVVQKISPCLWFDGAAEQAAAFYTELFPDSSVDRVTRHAKSGRGEPGGVMLVEFTLAGQRFRALNGGPQYAITPAVSFYLSCGDQAELDHYWDRLLEDGGAPLACGWLTDQFRGQLAGGADAPFGDAGRS